MVDQPVKSVETAVLRIAYVEHGPSDGWPVILSHGFPYDVHAFDEAAPILAQNGARVLMPFTRGFGPTGFISNDASRSGQQAARGSDIVQFADALGLERPILGGFDWGGNASCVAAALWPDRIGGLVSYAGYDVIDVSAQRHACASSGISISSRPSAAVNACLHIAAICAGSCGASGRPAGISMTRPSRDPRFPSTILTSWTS
jgi:pimeloyl-ACP methyl ester carboxylesterase